MRWIFVSLLVVNLLLLAWGMVFREAPGPAIGAPRPVTPYAYSDVAALRLLSESGMPAATKTVVPDSAPAQSIPRPSVPEKDGKPLCEMVGAFAGRAEAEQFIERLNAIDIQSSIRELELPGGSRYQVYLPPEVSHKAALRRLTELQAKKVDSYIIPKGELENGISLGMFSQENLAKQHLHDMEAIGLKPKMNIIERTYWETWVMLEPGQGGKMSSLAWERVMEGINDIERRQNFCLDVASQDNIH